MVVIAGSLESQRSARTLLLVHRYFRTARKPGLRNSRIAGVPEARMTQIGPFQAPNRHRLSSNNTIGAFCEVWGRSDERREQWWGWNRSRAILALGSRGRMEQRMSGVIYDQIGTGYSQRRRADPRIGALVLYALGDAPSVVNVGAGAGSYEPTDRVVQAVEPSDTMIVQRPVGAAPCVQASAEALPFEDGSFVAAMAVLTIHHWTDWRAGLREMRRVARRRVVLLTFDTDAANFWLMRDYLTQLKELDRKTMPALGEMAKELGPFRSIPVPVPHDCVDGFLCAYWRRPEVYLDPIARRSISSFAKINAEEGLQRLAADLHSGAWRQRNAELLGLEALDCGYRLLVWELGTS